MVCVERSFEHSIRPTPLCQGHFSALCSAALAEVQTIPESRARAPSSKKRDGGVATLVCATSMAHTDPERMLSGMLTTLSTPNPHRLPSIVARADEHLLVAAAKAGDSAAFEELVNRYERKIFRLTMNITGNREDAEDALQNAFLKSYTHLQSFQGESRFYTWLVRIAANEALMRLRKRRPNQFSLDEPIEGKDDMMPREIEDWGPSPEQRYAQTEMQEILNEVIEKLEPDFRTVFVLRDVEELSTEETAQALGISVPAVKSRLLRARLKLRQKLNRYFRKGERN
jgi:RNA polymerase sigma-70 factor (ECF subfamily)